jgi:hypothetical protein
MAFPSGVFDTVDVSSDLFSTWMRRRTEVEVERHQPYADLFLDEVLWPELLMKKDSILAALKEKCATATRPEELKVPIWSFSHVRDYPKKPWEDVGSPHHHFALQHGDKSALRVQQIHDNGWHPTLVLQFDDEDETTILSRMTLYNVIKKTDFCHQLALRFGGNFVVSLVTDGVDGEETDPSGDSFIRHKMSLELNYFPRDLPEYHQKKRQSFIEKFSLRVRRTLSHGEKLVYWKGEEVICHGPPPPSGPVKLLGHGCGGCYCYGHSDEE